MRKAVAPQAQMRTRDYTIKAPLKGWVTATNLADPAKDSATVLDNWVPQIADIRLRGGSLKWATISVSLPVLSIFTYESSASTLFAATETDVYDITTPATPTTIPTAAIAAQTSGYYSTAQFSTAGGTFLTIVNGTDLRQYYDGAAWTTLPAITGVTSSTLSHVWAYRNRLFFVQKNTPYAWYLGVDSVSGAASQISFAGVFKKGGVLVSGTTWSFDSSGTGLNDRCVFISSLGEVAVYEGVDPSSATTWSLVGIYEMGKLLGKNAILRIAGDVILLTQDGAVPLSAVVSKDRAALALNAISQPIQPDWQAEAVARMDNWTVLKWPEKNYVLVGIPHAAGRDEICFIVNSETGAWARFTGWDTNCVTMYGSSAYFGTNAGTIYRAESGGQDDTANYNCTYVGQYEGWGVGPTHKIAQLMRATFKSSVSFNPQVSVLTNFNTTLPSPPSAAAAASTDVWDTGLWDTAVWDSSGTQAISTRWRSVAGQGYAMAPVVQVTCGNALLPDGRLIQMQAKFGTGDIVV